MRQELELERRVAQPLDQGLRRSGDVQLRLLDEHPHSDA